MIDIKEALYNILHSRYGRDVRQSIHDGIYQINENANEAVQTAKAMGVGTDISSPTSSSTGYVAGNLYLNNSTWDLWQCIGTDSWVNKGNIKGKTGDKGVDGINYYIHIRYSDKYDGTGFTASPTASSEYMGVYYGTSQTAPTNKQDYQWTSYVGASGTSAYVHIMYSENADGTGFVSIPTPLCKYIGFYSGPLSSPPANKSYYTWSEYVGKSGTGSGDMTAAEYAPSGVYGKVDNAIKADNVGNADTSLLEKLSDSYGKLNYNGNALMLEAAQFANQAKLGEFVVNQISNNVKELALHSDITTKLPKSVPTTADEGKAPVVQSDGTVDWQKVSGSGTARIDISHTADDVYYYNLSEPTKQILVTGTSIDVGFGTYRFYQTDGSQKSEEQEVIVDTLKIYSVELSYFTAYITVNYPSYAKCLLTKGTTSINASNGVATVVPSDGVWSVKVYATNTAGEEVIGETSTVTIATDGQSETLTLNGLAKINLTWLSGFDSAITIENSAKGITYNGLLSGTSIIIPVNALGDWIIYGTHTGKQYKAKVTISSFGEEKSVYLKTSTTYAVHISMTEADPDNAVTFPSGYDNSDFSDNAYMDFTGGSFHYGNWADAFFMPRSCMLKFDGTVDYYLNEDDETKKEDGTASDVANINYGGNAMVEWGKIYFGFKGDADGNGYTFIVSDYSDEGIDCYCNIDENKNEIDHFYTPKYFASNDSSNRLRSISGQSNYVSQTGTTELSHAKANGNGWSTECYGDWTLIKHLLVLMSKSLDIQAKYGYGRCSTSNSTAIGQGTMNGKGRFWGDSSQTNGVKIFGMENWYGNIWRRIEGYVTNSSGVQLVKMCYGTRDGSTADGYSTGGTGYVSMGTTSGTSGSGIQSMHINNKCGVVPKALTGNASPTTYFSDGHWYGNSCYALVGGYWNYGLLVGAFCSTVDSAVSNANPGLGAAVSCKPLSA